jgi:hypothetical protein
VTVRVVDQPNKVTVTEEVVTVQVASVGVQGPPGGPGVEISPTEPTNTDILWADTTEPGDQVIPPGGGTGDVLAKVSSNDYDSGWVTLGLDDLSDVDLTGVADDDILQFDSALGVFLPVPIPSSGVPLPVSSPSAVDEVLAVDTVSPLATKWIAPSAWKLIYEETLASNINPWVIPVSGAYSILRVSFVGRINRVSVATRDIRLQFNGSTATNYFYTSNQTSATAGSVQSAADNSFIRLGPTAGDLGRTDENALFTLHIAQHPNRWRMVHWHFSGGGVGGYVNVTGSGQWRDTAAITSIDLVNDEIQFTMAAGSQIIVEGLA